MGEGGQETLADASEKVVNKLLNRVSSKKNRGSSSDATKRNSRARRDEGPSVCGAPAIQARAKQEDALAQKKNESETPAETETETVLVEEAAGEDDEVEWEIDADKSQDADCWNGELTIEVEGTSGGKKSKTVRRANARDKEFSELVHKLHLLCLLARGRLVDAACDDQLLRASIYSLLPQRLASVDPQKASVSSIVPLVKWLNSVLRITDEPCFESLTAALTQVLSKQSGTEEEIAAVSVALFRALGFKTRYVSVLDVVSIKPDAESLMASKNWGTGQQHESSFLPFATSMGRILANCDTRERYAIPEQTASKTVVAQQSSEQAETAQATGKKRKGDQKTSTTGAQESPGPYGNPKARGWKKDQRNSNLTSTIAAAAEESPRLSEDPEAQATGKKKRKCDEEFELEIARAMAATGAAVVQEEVTPTQTPSKRPKSSAPNVIWSRKKGPLLHWAEVFCGDDLSGKWCHVDAARSIVDNVQTIEAASTHPVRYVVAFAGSGAKDVTLRYISSWSKVVSLRVDQEWWDACVAPLRRLEENAYASDSSTAASSNPQERVSREDMELQVKSFTEPLPTNQQAYRNHHLYAMERWLTRYQVLHPKGPVLGSCGGNPIYPRTCVQDLHTKERWLREGFAVREGEEPVKVLKPRNATPRKQSPWGKIPADEEACNEEADERSPVLLFGKWQTDPWEPPPAVDGIVPKNDRGQVEVWSEKCIPPGTVHLKLPRLVPIVKMLGVDFAPAMVGFEIRQGRSVPVYEGLVVCEEFKDAILQVYRAEEQQRAAELQAKREEQAAVRWKQLLRSMVTRERLRSVYEAAAEEPVDAQQTQKDMSADDDHQHHHHHQHVHDFPEELQNYDEENCIRIKRCGCGFELRVEEM